MVLGLPKMNETIIQESFKVLNVAIRTMKIQIKGEIINIYEAIRLNNYGMKLKLLEQLSIFKLGSAQKNPNQNLLIF
jgi:hypothetical protein